MKAKNIKILLVGEYSGVHSELRNALIKKGLDVKSLSDGDGYKGFEADFYFTNPTKAYKSKILTVALEILGLTGLLTFLKKWPSLRPSVSGYDIVQLINPVALSGFGSIANIIFLRHLKKYNKKIFLCALGDDYYWVKENLKGDSKYNALKGIRWYNFYTQLYSTKYVYGLFYKQLNDLALNISDKIIPGLFDYLKTYKWSNKVTPLVPLPIQPEKIKNQFILNENEPIVLFHGWQIGKELRKGNIIFDTVAKRIVNDYPGRVIYRVVQSLPYDEYEKTLKGAHIAFDQCYSYDKGMNGLLYMATGKITFTGLDDDALKRYPYHTGEQIGINAMASENQLYNILSQLINNVDSIKAISNNAVAFVKRNHDSDFVAKLYLQIWGYEYLDD